MVIDAISPHVQRIAKKLASQNGYHEGYATEIIPGFSVPVWFTFVSEAQKLWLAHIAVNALNWDGAKDK